MNVATTYTDETSVLVDMHTNGLMSTLFSATVMFLTVLWPWMMCVPDRTIDEEEFAVATAPGTTYETYLRTRHRVNQTSHSAEFARYATNGFGADVMSSSSIYFHWKHRAAQDFSDSRLTYSSSAS